MKNMTKSVCIGLAMLATLSVAGSSFAGPTWEAEHKLLVQSLSDLRSARTKLHRVTRDFGGHARRAERSVEESIEAVESAIDHAKHHHDGESRRALLQIRSSVSTF